MTRIAAPLMLAAMILTAGLGPAATAQEAARPEETYTFALPERWQEVDRTRHDTVDILTFVPRGQSLGQWQDMVILQVYNDMTALPATALYDRTRANMKAACTDATAGEMQTGMSNGYPSAFWIVACAENKRTGQGEVAYFRSVQGQDNLYVVQRVWTLSAFGDRTPSLPPAEQQEAINILSALTLCQPGDPAHPCPGG